MFGPKVAEFSVFNPALSKAHCDNQTAEVFSDIASADSNLVTVYNIVENSREEDKRSTYEIGVPAALAGHYPPDLVECLLSSLFNKAFSKLS